jgi:hypothetical protein
MYSQIISCHDIVSHCMIELDIDSILIIQTMLYLDRN